MLTVSPPTDATGTAGGSHTFNLSTVPKLHPVSAFIYSKNDHD